jgi:saccharopine dehydrogenase-like protein
LDKVLILGGYGNFGKRIALGLAKKNIPVVVAGRNKGKAEALAATLPTMLAETAAFDMTKELSSELKKLRPAVVVNACGPFQTSNYDVANTCIQHGVHYIDLADGRDFVNGITALDAQARQRDVAVISGASTVPGLSSAVIEHYKAEFSDIESLVFGISPGQQAERGLSTTQAIMSYVGKPLKPFAGVPHPAYGWQDIYRQAYPELGKRWMANCDIPDLDLLPPRYGLRSIRFSAGLELGFMHLGLWALSWGVRLGLPVNLPQHANALLKASDWFNGLGSANGGMHMILRGKNLDGKFHERRWYIIAKNGDGPQLPTIPAIVLAEKFAGNRLAYRGASACVGFVTLEEYLHELKEFAVTTYSS